MISFPWQNGSRKPRSKTSLAPSTFDQNKSKHGKTKSHVLFFVVVETSIQVEPNKTSRAIERSELVLGPRRGRQSMTFKVLGLGLALLGRDPQYGWALFKVVIGISLLISQVQFIEKAYKIISPLPY